MKKLAYGFIALAGLAAVLALTPIGAAAQSTIRNITVLAMPADATELPAAAALGDNTANPTIPAVAAYLMCFDSTTWDRCPVGDGGAGTVSSNTSRITLASDDPAVVALQILDNAISGSEMQVDLVGSIPAGTNNIGDVDVASIAAGNNNIGDVDVASFPDNEPFNVAQIGGDVPTCADPADVTTVAIDTATSGNVQLVALASSQVVYICSYNFIASGTVSVQLIYGTGSACATGETDITGPYPLVANSGISVPGGGATLAKSAGSNALCIELSGAVQVSGLLTYVQR
jgi:hypothetical protein